MSLKIHTIYSTYPTIYSNLFTSFLPSPSPSQNCFKFEGKSHRKPQLHHKKVPTFWFMLQTSTKPWFSHGFHHHQSSWTITNLQWQFSMGFSTAMAINSMGFSNSIPGVPENPGAGAIEGCLLRHDHRIPQDALGAAHGEEHRWNAATCGVRYPTAKKGRKTPLFWKKMPKISSVNQKVWWCLAMFGSHIPCRSKQTRRFDSFCLIL